MNRWANFAVLAAFGFAERTPPPVVGADPPRCALGHRLTGISGFLNEEAVAKLRVIAVGIKQRVRAKRLNIFGVGDRIG
jgi:hypothetical protein